MKKLLLTIGSVAAIVAPVAAVVACSNADNNNDGGKNSNGHKADDKMAAISEINPFKNVKEDGLYLWKDHYTGTLWNGEGKPADGGAPSKNEIEEIGEDSGWELNPAVQIGNNPGSDKEDSFYMVYDKDDNDGITMDNFADTLFFEDTSVAMDQSIYDVNEKVFGNITAGGMFGKSTYVKFSEDKDKKYSGTINNFMGSQNNHVSKGEGYATGSDFMKKMQKLADQYETSHPDVLKTLLKYYGFKTTRNTDGSFDKDPAILNHASTGFAPVFYNKPIFTYKKVFDNVIQITYHDEDEFQCTAAHFQLKQKDGSYKKLGSWSLGAGDWSSYRRHQEAKYVGYKDPSLTNPKS